MAEAKDSGWFLWHLPASRPEADLPVEFQIAGDQFTNPVREWSYVIIDGGRADVFTAVAASARGELQFGGDASDELWKPLLDPDDRCCPGERLPQVTPARFLYQCS